MNEAKDGEVKKKKPRRKSKSKSKSVLLKPRGKKASCLGWCGGKLFNQKFFFDRFCSNCTRKKLNRESSISKMEKGEVLIFD